ncbi:RIP metalloprotease RseP [Candidatus Parcubacteria bacterium]|jgi:regulator of sigma E protease|nr:RIP metalloprotease RseP [Candidatus Parcubacteria bacterium]
MITLISFVLILGVLVLVHELGHFLTARKLGVDVEEFAIGFPPKLFSIKRKGIVYSINLIPVGGFVKIKGESGDHADDPHSFANQAAWKRAAILSAGVGMNFVLAIIALSVGFYFGLPQALSDNMGDVQISQRSIMIVEVSSNSVAAENDLQVTDEILTVNGVSMENSDMVYEAIDEHRYDEMEFLIARAGEEKTINLTPGNLEGYEKPVVGIGMLDTGVVSYGFFESIGQGLKATGIMAVRIVQAFGNLIGTLFSEGRLSAEVSGPVGVAVLTGKFVKMGWIYILQFMAILSINLAVINILPFPALDGGRLLFVGIEKIRGHKLNEKVEGWMHNSGFILLMGLIIFITFRDFMRYGGGIWTAIKNLF